MQRIKLYGQISTSLAALSNEKLKQILANGKPIHEGIGGKSALISIDDTPVFVKKVPLTDLEQLPQHFMSTANLNCSWMNSFKSFSSSANQPHILQHN